MRLSYLFRTICLVAFANDAAAQINTTSAGDTLPADIVVTGERPKRLPAAKVRDAIPPAIIKSYGEATIGDLLPRLRLRFGDGLSVLVNGRRLASLDAIAELPPEALAKIEVLNPGSAGTYGFLAGSNVINLALRPRFQFVTVEAEAAETTEGAGSMRSVTSRYSLVHGDRRFNLSVNAKSQAGIREIDRVRTAISDEANLEPQYRSLVPSQISAVVATGFATPLGDKGLDMSAEFGTINGRALSGLARNGSQNDSAVVYAIRQASDARFVRSSATLSGTVSSFFWSVLANAELGTTNVSDDRRAAIPLIGERFGGMSQVKYLPRNTRSSVRQFNLTSTITGPLLQTSAGAVTLNGSVSRSTNLLHSSSVVQPGIDISNTLSSNSAQIGLDIPLTGGASGPLSFVGALGLHQQISYAQTNDYNDTIGSTSSISWEPASRLSLQLVSSILPSLPNSTQRFAPLVERSGVLVYDSRLSQLVPAVYITGGRSDILTTTSRSFNAQAAYRGNVGALSFDAAANYDTSNVANPLISIGTPSAITEALFPSSFIRDAEGVLLAYDARSFTAAKQRTRKLSLNLHLSGDSARRSGMRDVKSDDMRRTQLRSPYTWDANINYSYVISDNLFLEQNDAVVDLLVSPISLSGLQSSRHRLSGQGTFGWKNGGLNGSVAWSSGVTAHAVDGDALGPTRYSSVLKIGLNGFFDFARSAEESNPSSLRVKLGVENALNRRQRIIGYSDSSTSLQQLLLDPYGRTVRLTIRKSL